MSDDELKALLSTYPGWGDWMVHWVFVKQIENGWGEQRTIALYCCYHPDNTMFYASTDPAQAVAAFGREEFAYHD